MNEMEEYIKNEMQVYCFLNNPKPIVPNLPSNVYIETTNACNLDCLMCARAKMNRPVGFMTFEDFKKIIDKFLAEKFQPPITLTGNGEPLLNASIFSMIKYAKSNGFNVSLISNSTTLKESNIRKIIDSGLDRFQTMFDSIEKEIYEKIRTGANYEKTKKTLIKLINLNEDLGHPMFISVGMVEMSLNKKSLEKTKAFWESLPIDNFYHSPLFTLQSYSGLYEEAIKGIDMSLYKVCVAPWIRISIAFNGDAVLCPQDFLKSWVVGNIFKESIKEIWNGNNAIKLRKALLENDLKYFTKIGHSCEKCNAAYLSYSIEDYLQTIPSRVARKIQSFHSQKN